MRLRLIVAIGLILSVTACSTERTGSSDTSDTSARESTGSDTGPDDAGPSDAIASDTGPDGVSGDDARDNDIDAGGENAGDPRLDDAGSSDAAPSDVGVEPDASAATPPSFVVGTWNLHDFSAYGVEEYRIDDIASRIDELAPDVLGVEELKVAYGTDGSPPQAWDALLELLPAYAGLHAPWDVYDTTDGLIYRTDRVSVDGFEVLFEDDWWAFPRSPLVVDVTVTEGEASAEFSVIVLHLKAFDADADRRLAACERLDAWIDDRPDRTFVIVGDLNDDPYDPPEDNVFVGTFLDVPEQYVFVTAAFPPETVTSTGWYHLVDGVEVSGELIDHVIVTTPFYGRFNEVTPAVYGVPEAQFDDYRAQYSDHFPVMVSFEAP